MTDGLAHHRKVICVALGHRTEYGLDGRKRVGAADHLLTDFLADDDDALALDLLVHHAAPQYARPRAETGQTVSTLPPRTPTYQSCTLQVGSQWPGTRRSFSLTLSTASGSATTPCSSEHLTYSTSLRPKMKGRPLSTDCALRPASTMALSALAWLMTDVRINSAFSHSPWSMRLPSLSRMRP